MNEYDDILNRIVEEFYDTGKLKLSEDIEFDVDNEDFGVETDEEIVFTDTDDDIDDIELDGEIEYNDKKSLYLNIFNKYFIEGLSQKKVAEQLNINDNKIKRLTKPVNTEQIKEWIDFNDQIKKEYGIDDEKLKLIKLLRVYFSSNVKCIKWNPTTKMYDYPKPFTLEELKKYVEKLDSISEIERNSAYTNIKNQKPCYYPTRSYKLYRKGTKERLNFILSLEGCDNKCIDEYWDLLEIISKYAGELPKPTDKYLIYLVKKYNGNRNKIINDLNQSIEFGRKWNIDNFNNFIKTKKGEIKELLQKMFPSTITEASKYESYWANDTQYFVGESDKEDQSLIKDYQLEFDNSIMSVIEGSNIKDLKIDCEGVENFTINYTIIEEEVERLVGLVNPNAFTEKFDIKCIKEIQFDGKNIITVGDYLDVKKRIEKDSFLIELSAPFKTTNFGEGFVGNTDIQRKKCNLYIKVYNDLIDRLLSKITKQLDTIKNNILSGDKPFSGLIIEDNTFVPLTSLNLYWSNKGARTDHRITLRYKINGPVYRIKFNPQICGSDCLEEQTYVVEKEEIKGSDNYEQLTSDIFSLNQPTDRLDEIIENFFDTGKFVI